MELQWWQDWFGWLITTILAAVAAGVAVMQEVRHLRSRPNASLWLERAGDVIREHDRWERFRVANIGTGPVRLLAAVVNGAKPGFPDGDTYRLPRTFLVGEEHHIAVRPGSAEEGWVLLIAHHPHRRNRIKVWWLPLDMDGPLGEKLQDQLTASRSVRASVARLFRREPRAVRPGGRRVAVLRASASESRYMEILSVDEGWSLLG